MKKLSLKPPERVASLQAVWDEPGSADQGPCGGFSHQYWCVCDYLGLPYREEVQWGSGGDHRSSGVLLLSVPNLPNCPWA
ncbi:hypothetical protein FQN60_002205 [Etheostoma spectabile]|uniref:Uncharacterized protein n=2 Tax=Etheostoma spectabile TaxID=54343 RepID=A0A5J5D9B9_9PERO|nr:hypothetical protein FQN60_007931 [Etheostoma spectabile]KAA8591262.1 hypothetical protein FQN60_002205 [Etheostoma spectabile]